MNYPTKKDSQTENGTVITGPHLGPKISDPGSDLTIMTEGNDNADLSDATPNATNLSEL